MKLAFTPEPDSITVPAGEFKAKCLKLIDVANEKQQPITITKRGKVVGQFVPNTPEPKPFRSFFGRTPGVHMPNEATWKILKDDWTNQWDESTDRLARQIKGDFKAKR